MISKYKALSASEVINLQSGGRDGSSSLCIRPVCERALFGDSSTVSRASRS